MPRERRVERPQKRSEYEIRFATLQAQRGWTDLCATSRNALAEAWDFLTRTPTETTPSNYRLRGELGVLAKGDEVHERWQYKPTRQGDARLWFFVVGRTVFLEQVHTHHPNATK